MPVTMTLSPNGSETSGLPPDLTCPPRFFTPRNLDRPTLGPKVGEVARQLGTPFMPWQQFVADVAMEIDPVTGLLFYREIVFEVPRQSGKSTFDLAVAVHRALGWSNPQVISYAAQTRNDSRKKWEDNHVAALDGSPIGKRRPKPYRVRKTNGNEAILWRNGSRHGISASGETSGHGDTLDLAFIDEAFAQKDRRLEQAFKPAMITRPDPQLFIMSTAGRSEKTSPYLWEKVKAGRERCDLGSHPGVAYFEWSASDEMDRADPATWWATMPALGHTITEAAVRADFESMDPAEFDRAYLNRWNPNSKDSVLPGATWGRLNTSSGMSDPVALAIDVAPDSSSAAIAAAGAGIASPGRTAVEVIEHRPGTTWLVDRLAEILAKLPTGTTVSLDARGPAGLLLPALTEAKIEPVLVSTSDHGKACGMLLDAVLAESIEHRDQADLNDAVAGASRRTVTDVWLWSRRSSSVDICPLVAVTLAHWGHLQPAAGPSVYETRGLVEL